MRVALFGSLRSLILFTALTYWFASPTYWFASLTNFVRLRLTNWLGYRLAN